MPKQAKAKQTKAVIDTNQDLTLKKRAMIAALEKTLGVVTQATTAVGISRTQHYNWLKDDPEYAQAVNDVFEMSLDFAESKLFLAIKRDELQAIFYYLNNKGKRRGYNRPDHVQDDTTPAVVDLVPTRLAATDDGIDEDNE
jgi:hypothetical protein